MPEKKLTIPKLPKFHFSDKLLAKKNLLIGLGVIIVLILAFFGFKFMAKSGLSWCKSGSTLQLKGQTFTAVDVENYSSSEYHDRVCHLTNTYNGIVSDYYLDAYALAKFQGSMSKNVGNGCIVYSLPHSSAKTEFCFGVKIK